MSKESVEGDSEAVEIADELLYRSGTAAVTRDFSAFYDCFNLPHVLETAEGRWVMETEDEIRQVFDSVCDYYSSNNVTNVVRTVIKAKFIDQNTIGSTHVSRLLQSEGQTFRKPYPTFSILKNTKVGWKVASCSYAILDSPGHNHALKPKQIS